MTTELNEEHIPKTFPHVFDLQPLAEHFANNPIPTAACRLIDLPGDDFLDTEDKNYVIEASLWVMSAKFDNLPKEERPNTRDLTRKVRMYLLWSIIQGEC
nr:hypothetical protein L203_05946 [Cryptococcus depauperatus CBS 7841]ODO04184.1 hypothetical protein L204_00539 [Cryptococcus depauperatus CBS 7855]